MKYFVLLGLLPKPIERAPTIGGEVVNGRDERVSLWRTAIDNPTLPKEGEECYLRVSDVGRISAFVHDISDARLLVVARSQESAYYLASALRASAAVFLGYQNDDGMEWLLELDSRPKPEHTLEDFAGLYRQIWTNHVDRYALMSRLGTGHVIERADLAWICRIVRTVQSSEQLYHSLLHLERSNYLLSGYMTSSYYHSNYRNDRVDESQYARRKKYLENRTLYDLAFLSGFRAIEAILDTPHLQKKDLPRKIIEVDQRFGTKFSTSRWRSFHEQFSSRRKWWSYEELIAQYLKVRNAVAAHANPRPPFALTEDQVFEIQLLARTIIYDVCKALDDSLE